MRWDLKGIGAADYDRKVVKCEFSISSDEFFRKFSREAEYLSSDNKDIIAKSIDRKSSEKIKKREDEVPEFFTKVNAAIEAANLTSRSAAPAAVSSQQTEKPKEEPKAARETKAEEKKESSSQGEKKGEKVPIKVVETIVAKYPYTFVAPKQEGEKKEEGAEEKKDLGKGYGILTRDGKLTIKNVSADNRIWDVSGKLTNNGAIEKLEEKLYFKELAANEEKPIEYKLKAEKEPSVKVEEFISTINDPQTLSYALIINEDNKVFFKTTLKNNEKYTVKNVVYKKTLFDGNSGVAINSTSKGEAKQEDKVLSWTIPEMEANSTETIEFVITVKISDKDQKIRSGTMELTYEAESSLSELKIENFEAYGNNRVVISDEQLEEKPDMYKGSMKFENLSNYLTILKKVTAKLSGTEQELIQVPSDPIQLGANESWTSNEWEVDTKGDIPAYIKEAQFILMPELISTTTSSVQFEDLELAVAIFEADIEYDLKALASYREVPFNAKHFMNNAGAAAFDYISIKHIIAQKFRPPKKEDMKLKVNDKVYDLKPEWIKIEPDNDDPSVEHNIFVELNDLRNTEIQGIKPGQKVTLEYPMAAVNLTKDDSLVTNCEWTANTYPRGQPIIITQMGKEEKGIVPVTHQRIKVVRGKALLATEDEKIHDVVLSLQNNSGFDVSNFVVKDAAPAGYDAYEFSMKPDENTEKVGDREAMVWKLEKIEKDATVEIKYKIKAVKEDAYASDAQFSL